LQDPRQGLPSSNWSLWRRLDGTLANSGVCGLDPIVRTGPHEPAVLPCQVIVLSRSLWVLLASLALTLVAGGCGGASPETRVTQTQVALYGTRTPTPLEAARTVIAAGTFTELEPEIAASLTAEASLSIATPETGNVATHMAQFANR
jgi:hypothetical protein